MWGQIVIVFQAIRALLDLIKFLQNWKIQQDKIKAEKRQQELEKAVDNSKNAQTDEEIWKSQDEIIKNKPE
jgi:hypothetical protein